MKKILLSIALVNATYYSFSQCNELFISEYCEGSGNNKGIEIYNPTLNSINLSGYHLVRFSNGSTVGTDSLILSGTIASGDVWVIVNGQTVSQPGSPACDPAMQALADQLDGAYPAPTYMNGNDAMVLTKMTPYMRIDILGKIGEDPGQSWTDMFPYTDAQGAYWTKDHTLRRKATIMQGVTTNPTAYNATVEWDSLPENTWTGLGAHTCNCPMGVEENTVNIKMTLYPNPSTNGSISITATEEIKEIQIVNSLGQVVKTMAMNAGTKNAEVSTLELIPGLYFVNVVFETAMLTNKVTLQ
ncbi:MAG: lamin tail domain-containing protein [Flavobacteriales bacterium]